MEQLKESTAKMRSLVPLITYPFFSPLINFRPILGFYTKFLKDHRNVRQFHLFKPQVVGINQHICPLLADIQAFAFGDPDAAGLARGLDGFLELLGKLLTAESSAAGDSFAFGPFVDANEHVFFEFRFRAFHHSPMTLMIRRFLRPPSNSA